MTRCPKIRCQELAHGNKDVAEENKKSKFIISNFWISCLLQRLCWALFVLDVFLFPVVDSRGEPQRLRCQGSPINDCEEDVYSRTLTSSFSFWSSWKRFSGIIKASKNQKEEDVGYSRGGLTGQVRNDFPWQAVELRS